MAIVQVAAGYDADDFPATDAACECRRDGGGAGPLDDDAVALEQQSNRVDDFLFTRDDGPGE